MNIVIVRKNYTKKNNPNKATRIQFESIPRDIFGLISIKYPQGDIINPINRTWVPLIINIHYTINVVIQLTEIIDQ